MKPKRIALLLAASLILAQAVAAQQTTVWRNKQCAVVLTYDDALNVQLTNVIPALDSFGLKGTFYLADFFGGLCAQLPKWRAAALNGHELANHTVYHPCASGPGRGFVTQDYDLKLYTVRRITNEMKTMNMLLQLVDGKTRRTFAFPCGDTKIHDTNYIDYAKNEFVCARAVRNEMPTIDKIDLYNVPSYTINGQSGEELINLVKQAMASHTLLVFLFHGVGGESALNVSVDAHRKLLQFLKENEKDVWVATMLDVADHVNNYKQQIAFRQQRDSINKITEADYKLTLASLNISSIRQGANGNDPNAPNAANYDESKANPYPVLPDPLTLKNGRKVTDAKTWWNKRRPEIAEDFDREVYGRTPKNLPKVNWEVISTQRELNAGIPVITKKLLGHVDNSAYPQVKVDIQLSVSTPANSTAPVPLIMELAFVFPPSFNFPRDTAWQQQLLQKGWGYAVMVPVSVQADNGAGLTQGIIGLVNKGQRRKADDWGALKAWAWGASKAMDYFETDKSIDAKRIGIEGHSRYGKAALVTMAYDPRFAIGFISSSGEGGAKLHRRNAGELVENVASSGEYHWMANNFIKYAGPLTWNDLPVDAHELIALCAPRPVFISAGNVGDAWVDVRGMFMAAAAAGPVYTLLGKKDLGTNEFPPIEKGLMDGDLTYRQHNGGHTPAPNWPTFISFAERYFGSTGLKDVYKDYFKIGVAVSPRALKTDESGLILQHYNSLTPENAMKMGPIHPKENEFNWRDADSIVAFAQRNKMLIRGHTLCWHNQVPRWLFIDSSGNTVSKEVLLQRLKAHITAVVSRYKGKVYAWDVVNEAISDKRDEYLRPSQWLQICGEEYIAKAFQWAHEADPNAVLFYNDYNEIDPVKREKIFRLVKSLKDAGVPIHGLGLQGHWAVNEPSEGQLDSTLKRFAELGVNLQVTELDISVYPKEHNARQRRPEDSDTAFSAAKEQKQIEVYKMCFSLFRKYKNAITSVTFWNISDRSSWLDNFPVPGRKDYPLLFDKNLQPKKAYWEVTNFTR